MLFLDKPYISDFLLKTLEDSQLPVLDSDIARQLAQGRKLNFMTPQKLVEVAKITDPLRLLTASENSIGWITEHLDFLDLPETINLFKDKVKFRQLLSGLHEDFSFRAVDLDDMDKLDAEHLPYPFIIKPAVGFFSMGVHKVSDRSQWPDVKVQICDELKRVKGLYPTQVMDGSTFIIEQMIEGDEFAVDAYFDEQGEAVILNIYQHLFSDSEDVSDRVYITSKEIIEERLAPFTDYLNQIGALADVKNFPVHVELRVDNDGVIRPIEVNPMRFGGWCTTADMSWFAYGINSYLAYHHNERPQWDEILKDRAGLTYAIVVLDNSTGVESDQIASFDYEKLRSRFAEVMELRKIDYRAYPVFGFAFTKTAQQNLSELDDILRSDLSEFITVDG